MWDHYRTIVEAPFASRPPSIKDETLKNSTRRPERRATRYPFAATAEVGVYLAMPDSFSKGAVILNPAFNPVLAAAHRCGTVLGLLR
jgi:hypothetical protein